MTLATEDDHTHHSSYYNDTESFQTSNSTTMANLPPPSTYFLYSSPRSSYFNSAIETAIKQHSHDDEPIPFIDENISVTHSRKSSACWSDRTSLSSRFGIAWKLNLLRSTPQIRPSAISSNETGTSSKRFNYRTVRYTVSPSSAPFEFHDEL